MKLKTIEKSREAYDELLKNGGSLRKVCDDNNGLIGYIVRKTEKASKEENLAVVDIFLSLADGYRSRSSVYLNQEELRAFSVLHAVEKDITKKPFKEIVYNSGKLSEEDEKTLEAWIKENARDIEKKHPALQDGMFPNRIKDTGVLLRRSFREAVSYFKDIETIKIRFCSWW